MKKLINKTERQAGAGRRRLAELVAVVVIGLFVAGATARPPQGEGGLDRRPQPRGENGDRPRRGDHDRGHRESGQLGEAETALVMSTLAKVNPETHKKLEQMREKRPQMFQAVVRRYYPAIRAITSPIGEGGLREHAGHFRDGERGDDRADRPDRADRRDKRPSGGDQMGGDIGKHLDKPRGGGRNAEISIEDLTAEREAAILEVVNEMHPRLAGYLKKAKAEDPDRYKQALLRIARHRRVQHMLQTRQRYPETYDALVQTARLDVTIEKLAKKLNSAKFFGEPDKTKALESELRETLLKKFDATLRLREARLSRMSDQLKKVEAELRNAPIEREQWVDREMERLKGERGEHMGDPGDRRPSPPEGRPARGGDQPGLPR